MHQMTPPSSQSQEAIMTANEHRRRKESLGLHALLPIRSRPIAARRRLPWLIGAGLVAVLGACGSTKSFWRPTTATRQEDVASAHVAVVAVAPWDQYCSAVQPNFTMTPDEALQQVVPTTATYDER